MAWDDFEEELAWDDDEFKALEDELAQFENRDEALHETIRHGDTFPSCATVLSRPAAVFGDSFPSCATVPSRPAAVPARPTVVVRLPQAWSASEEKRTERGEQEDEGQEDGENAV